MNLKRVLGRLILSVFAFLCVASFSYAEDLKGYFIKQDTFLYLYLNAEKVRISKIYASIDKYLLKDNYKGYSKLRKAAEKVGITEKNISEIYFSYSLKNVKALADIKQESVYYLSGIVLKEDITTEKLLEVLKESLKNESFVNLGKIQQANNEIIQIKTKTDSMYATIPQSKLVLTSNDLSNLIILIDSYKARKAKSLSNNVAELLSQISSSAPLYGVVAVPPFMIKELQKINGKVKRNEQQDIKYKINNAVVTLNAVTIETKTDDTLYLKINTFFSTEDGAKVFNELANQFMPLLKFQLFMMVQNSTLPVLNTIATEIKKKSVSLSSVLTSDDFASISQIIKK